MKRLLLVTTSFPANGDGSEAAGAFVADFADALQAHAHVAVVAPALKAGLERRASGVEVRRFAVPRLPLSTLSPLDPRNWGAIFSSLVHGQRSVLDAARTHQADHILALWALPSGAWARSAARALGIRYSTWALGSDIWTLGKIPGVRHYLRGVLQQAQQRYADGLQLAADVCALSGMDCGFMASSRRLDIPASAALRRTAEGRKTLAFLGRWHPNKGIDLLLEALLALNEQDWAGIAAVRIAGGGPLADLVNAQVSRLKAAGRPVELLGFLDQAAAVDFIRSADWLLLPSRIESIPVIFSDAMQCGTPLVATPVGDLPQLMTMRQGGVLARSVSAEGITDGIREALHTPITADLRSSLQEAARQFDVAQVAQMFAKHVSVA